MSGIATGTALAIGLGTSAAAGVAGSLISGSEQAGASKSAAQLQAEEQDKSLAFQQQEYNQQQANEKPFLQAGQGAVTQLSNLLQPGGALTQNWTGQFAAPTAAQAAATPGYQFQLQQGTQALNRSAAATGNLLSGGTVKAAQQYGQGLASTNYQNVFNNNLATYQQAYNQFQQNQANQYNRLAGLAGTGQVSAGQLGASGSAAAGNTANILLGGGAQIGQDIQNAGAARASGYVGGANAVSGAAGGFANLATLSSLLNPATTTPSSSTPADFSGFTYAG